MSAGFWNMEVVAERMGEHMKLKNKAANMEIGYVNSSGQKKLYVQVGNERQYYGTLMASKADSFLEMLKQWDKAGGSDE